MRPRAPWRSRPARGGRWLAVLLLVLFCAPQTAFAHASLVETLPEDGVVVAASPPTIRLRFNEPITPISVRLVDPAGRDRQDVTVHAMGDTIDITAPPLPAGTQTVSYRIISADGHPVGGVLQFSVGHPGGGGSTAMQPASVRLAAIWVTRVLAYFALFAGIGGTFFLTFIEPLAGGRNGRLALFATLSVGWLAIIASTALQGLDVLDGDFSALLTAGPWEAAMATSFGMLTMAATAALLVAASALIARRPAVARAGACLALAGLGAGMAATGHAGSASPQWLTRPAVFVHVVGATIWVGALVPLLSLALGRSPLLAGALRRFSRIAVGTVAVQVAAGGALMLVQLDAPIAVLNTPYTWILGAKLALVAALLVVAGFNHLSWAPATATGNPAAARRIARSVAAEIVLMAGVLMLVAGWRFTPPPRAIQPPPPPTLLHLEGDGFMAMVRLDPGRVGPNKARINLAKPDGSDFTAQEVSLAFAPADGKLEERTVAAHRTADGTWIADTVFLPTPGLWTLSVMALVDDFDRLEASDATEIRP